jgi:hypothetical protein
MEMPRAEMLPVFRHGLQSESKRQVFSWLLKKSKAKSNQRWIRDWCHEIRLTSTIEHCS